MKQVRSNNIRLRNLEINIIALEKGIKDYEMIKADAYRNLNNLRADEGTKSEKVIEKSREKFSITIEICVARINALKDLLAKYNGLYKTEENMEEYLASYEPEVVKDYYLTNKKK